MGPVPTQIFTSGKTSGLALFLWLLMPSVQVLVLHYYVSVAEDLSVDGLL